MARLDQELYGYFDKITTKLSQLTLERETLTQEPSEPYLEQTNQEQGNTWTIMSNINYNLFGSSIKINETPTTNIKEEVLISKDVWVKLDNNVKMKLLDQVKAEQQTKYHTISVSVDDPDKMGNTHSLSALLLANQSNMKQYDFLTLLTQSYSQNRDPSTIHLPITEN